MFCTRYIVNSRQKKVIFVMPLILYSVAIFLLSSFPQPDFIDLGFKFWDKLLHLKAFFIYGIFTIAAIASLRPMIKNGNLIALVLIIGFLFGLSDEIHQYFVPGRDADIWDLAADTAGVAISLTARNIVREYVSRICTV